MNKDDCIFEKEYLEVIPYEVRIKCPKCKIGYLVAGNPLSKDMKIIDNENYLTHYCNNPNCNNFENLKDMYPKIEYRYKEFLNEEKLNEKSINTNKEKTLVKVFKSNNCRIETLKSLRPKKVIKGRNINEK